MFHRSGVCCREDDCDYECQPKLDRPMGKLLGLKPGNVELCTLKGCKDFPMGMTLNNAPKLCGREFSKFRGVVRALKNHYSKHHPGIRPVFLYKKKEELNSPDRATRDLFMQRARMARSRERKTWDRDILVKRGINIYKMKHPPSMEPHRLLAQISDISFYPWVKRLKMEPVSTAMLVGDEPWVFQFHPWRMIHKSLLSKAQSTVHGTWNAIIKCFSAALVQKSEEETVTSDDKMLHMLYECFLCQINMILSDVRLRENFQIPTFVIENVIHCVRGPGVGYTGNLRRVERVQDWEARCRQWMADANCYAQSYADEVMVRRGAVFLASVSNTSIRMPLTDEEIVIA